MKAYTLPSIFLLVAASLLLSGCPANLGGSSYSRSEARHPMSIRFAVVESVRPVTMEGTKTPVGTAAGGIVGGIVGSTMGKNNNDSAVGAALGAIIGGLVGTAIEEGVSRKEGIEITVKLANGEYLAIVQQDEGENFKPGERVRLVGSGEATRVARD